MEINKLNEYKHILEDIKLKIKTSQIKASIAFNQELIKLYFEIGKTIVKKQNESGWGSKIIEKLSKDLCNIFGEKSGYSTRNLKYMLKIYNFYSNSNQKVQQLVAQIPWRHNILIITKIKNVEIAKFYIEKTIENNWSRSILEHQIELELHKRIKNKTNNFELALPKEDSDLAKEIIKENMPDLKDLEEELN